MIPATSRPPQPRENKLNGVFPEARRAAPTLASVGAASAAPTLAGRGRRRERLFDFISRGAVQALVKGEVRLENASDEKEPFKKNSQLFELDAHKSFS